MPWALHPETTVRSGKCVVSMLYASFVKRNKKRVIENGRTKLKSFYEHVLTEEQIERDLDRIFVELGYVAEEYPYESGWREDGCTTKMVLAFCRKHDIICHVYHNVLKNGNELESYSPSNPTSNTPRVDFFIRDDHCYFYGKQLDDESPCLAKQAISQMWRDPVLSLIHI